MRRIALLVLASLLIAAAPAQALWRSIRTSSFTLFYPEPREAQARRVLAVLEGAAGYVEGLLGYRPGRVTVVLTDVGILANGLTDPVFRRILLYPYSPSPEAGGSPGSLGTLQSWWRLLWIHEYAHWVHLDMAAGVPRGIRALFGNVLAPNLFAPTWLHEGICVYAESAHSPFEGRLNDGTFAAYARALAREQALPSIAAATFQDSDFPGGAGPYLYGGMFFDYLVQTYGEEALRAFLESTGSSIGSYFSPLLPALGLDLSARRAFGRSLPALWKQWQEAQGAQAAAPAPTRVLTRRPGWLEEPTAWGGWLFYRRSRVEDSRPQQVRRLYELVRLDPESGQEKVLVRSTGPFTGPLVVRDGTLYYALLELDHGFANTELAGYGFTAQVWALDLQTRRRHRLFTAPLRTFTVLADGYLLCSQDRQAAFGSEIRLFRLEGGSLEPLLETDYLVAEIESGPAGLFVSARRDGEGFGVYRVLPAGSFADVLPEGEISGVSLAGVGPAVEGLLSLEPLVDSPWNQGRLCLAGDRLYFSANPGGRYRIYGRDLSSGRMAVSDSLDYQDAPAFDPQTGRLYALGLEAGGFTLCELPDPLAARGPGEPGADPQSLSAEAGGESRRAGTAAWAPPAARPPSLSPVQVRSGGYLDNLGTLLPRALLPLFSFDSTTWDVQAGAAVLGRSALGDIDYHVSVYYDSGTQRGEVEAALGVQPAAPLRGELSFSTYGTNALSLALLSPLVSSLTPGVSYLTAGMTARLFGPSFSHFELAPLVSIGLQGPFTELDLGVRLPLESSSLGSDRDALALIFGLGLVQRLGPLELGLDAVGLSSFDGSYWRLPAPPAYPEGLLAALGAHARVDGSLRMLRIRQGLWNPGFYLEDVYLTLFSEAALDQALVLQLSYGLEIHLELRVLAAATGVPADLFVRAALDMEGRPEVSIGLETVGLDDYVRIADEEVSKP